MATIEKEKALDVVRQMVADGQVSQEVAEKYFPEIKKYKDEIVKKQILELIRQHSVNSDRCMMENWVCSHALLQPFKPSKEQMGIIAQSVAVLKVSGYDELGDRLGDISEQLNRLMEE